jgi:DhnA family fructose-bisphosphate aldolase class Ia
MSLLADDNKALILAMDHALTLGPVPGLKDPGAVIDAAIEAGADAVMTSFGIVKKYRDRLIGRIPTILRLDGGPSIYREDWMAYTEYSLLHSVENALFLGVDAVVLNLFVGIPVELETYKNVANVAGECMRAKLPLVVEALACASERIPDPKSGEAMGAASRIAFEHGADLIKTYYTGSREGLEETLQVVYDAMQAGARGIVFGRNIWQSGNTQAMIDALRHIIHHDGSVSAAMAKLT